MARHRIYRTNADRQWAYRVRQKNREDERSRRMQLEQIAEGLIELVEPESAFEEFEQVPGRLIFKHKGYQNKPVELGNGWAKTRQVLYRTPDETDQVSGMEITCSNGLEEHTYLIGAEEWKQLTDICRNMHTWVSQALESNGRNIAFMYPSNGLAFRTRSGFQLEAVVEIRSEVPRGYKVTVTLAGLITLAAEASDDLLPLYHLFG